MSNNQRHNFRIEFSCDLVFVDPVLESIYPKLVERGEIGILLNEGEVWARSPKYGNVLIAYIRNIVTSGAIKN